MAKKHKFSIFGKLKTFFFERWHPLLTIFPYPEYIKEWLKQKSYKKKWFPPHGTIFFLVGHGGNFPNKMAKYGHFETELERVNKQ